MHDRRAFVCVQWLQDHVSLFLHLVHAVPNGPCVCEKQ